MIPLLAHIDLTLPLEDPILKFLLILVIILAAPLILNKLKIPYLLGLIIAGAVIGPHGLNLVLRDSSIILSGTAGLLYIMFLSGLDMDMSDFRRNSWRSLVFGLYTFCVPLGLGILAGYYVMGFPLYSSILLAGLFASQTLVAYPIVSKLGIARDKAVTIAVGGTVITDTLALLLLTVIVGMATGNVDDMFWWRLGASVLLCIVIIVFLFPLLAHWFFKQVSDSVSQYIFVLAMVFLGAYLAHMAGLEPIIGAFLSGLALNRLIPRTSPLMNRIEFVGNAIFIPFFLIGVGMLIDYRAFFRDWESIEVAAIMIALITAAKFIAAWLTQKSFRLSKDQRTVIFGLSSAHVAATLAAVLYVAMSPANVAMTAGAIAPQVAEHSYLEYIQSVIPDNFLAPFLSANVLSVLLVSAAIGIAISRLPRDSRSQEVLLAFFTGAQEVLFILVKWLIRVLPIGIFGFISALVVEMNKGVEIGGLGTYFGVILAANFIQMLVVLPLLMLARGVNPIRVAKGMAPALAVAFFSKSSAGTLPVTMSCAENNVGVARPVSRFVLPICTTINMNGCAAFILVTVVYLMQNAGAEVTLPMLAAWILISTLAAVGNAGVPMGCFFLSASLLASMNVPIMLMGVILPFYAVIDMIETTLNVWSDSTVAAMVNHDLGKDEKVDAES